MRFRSVVLRNLAFVLDAFLFDMIVDVHLLKKCVSCILLVADEIAKPGGVPFSPVGSVYAVSVQPSGNGIQGLTTYDPRVYLFDYLSLLRVNLDTVFFADPIL